MLQPLITNGVITRIKIKTTVCVETPCNKKHPAKLYKISIKVVYYRLAQFTYPNSYSAVEAENKYRLTT